MYVRDLVIISNVLELMGEYATYSQPAPNQFTLSFVTCIYHQEIWHAYNMNC